MVDSLPPKLATALVEAQKNARAVAKDSKNEFLNYRYASAESMIDEGRLSLGAAGLILMQAGVDFVLLERELDQGKERARVMLRITYLLSHSSGEARSFTRAWPCVEANGRPIDKAFGGALTTALSYTIRDLLLLPRDDEKAAMDRRESGEVVDRDMKPANVSQEQPKPANDRAAGCEHPFARLLPLIQSRALKPELLAGEIDKESTRMGPFFRMRSKI